MPRSVATAGTFSRSATIRSWRQQGPDEARALLDPYGWLSWDGVRSVLCLASGGGLQGPLFAYLGFDVTVADISPGQLARDREVAEQRNLQLELLEADMLDLGSLHGRNFDLVYQGVSACYVPDVDQLYREVAAVLRPGGTYVVDHWAPHHLQLDAAHRWDGTAYRLNRPVTDTAPILWQAPDEIVGRTATCWHFVHPLSRLVGGLCAAGFAVTGFEEINVGDASAEPDSEAHLAAHLPPLIRLMARRNEV
jgi:SAM-dependent methyltransferase